MMFFLTNDNRNGIYTPIQDVNRSAVIVQYSSITNDDIEVHGHNNNINNNNTNMNKNDSVIDYESQQRHPSSSSRMIRQDSCSEQSKEAMIPGSVLLLLSLVGMVCCMWIMNQNSDITPSEMNAYGVFTPIIERHRHHKKNHSSKAKKNDNNYNNKSIRFCEIQECNISDCDFLTTYRYMCVSALLLLDDTNNNDNQNNNGGEQEVVNNNSNVCSVTPYIDKETCTDQCDLSSCKESMTKAITSTENKKNKNSNKNGNNNNE